MDIVMEYSIRERKIWIELVIDVVVSFYYFTSVYQLSGWDEITGNEMGLIIRNSIAFAIIGAIILHVIFVRNVLIYFDAPTKKDILERMTKNLNDDGYLFLGGSETTLGVTDELKGNSTKHGTVYTKSQASPEVSKLELA